VGRLKARGVEAEGFLARGNTIDTIDTIVEYSKRLSIDLIVVGHYPKPAGGRWWSGPERAALAERVSCSVLIAMGQ
jgi:nucleotide-binding universal stress UspA family protein